MQKIKLGIFEELTLQLGTRNIGCVLPINTHELISTTMREIRRFEGEEMKECVKLPFSCACFIPEVELIAAHTVSGSEIWVMKSSDLSHPILSNYKTGQTCVYHMIYSQKSKSIITIGSGIKVFSISWKQKGSHYFSSNFEVTISLRSEFADDYDASLLNPPSFDEENEHLFLPTPEGICSFDLDGELIYFASKLPANNNTSYSFCKETGKLLSFDPTDGLCLWKKDGTIDKRINITSMIIIGLRFIDTENVVCLSSSYSLFLLNIKTGNSFECFNSPPYTRLTRFTSFQLYRKPHVFMCYGNKLTILRVNAPWKVFSLGVIRARSIQRFSKPNEAARICVMTDNSFLKLYNPKKSCFITSATPSQPIYPSSFFYDRGIFIHFTRDTLYPKYLSNAIEITNGGTSRDYLYLVYEDGSVCKFDTNVSPASEMWIKKLRAHLITAVYFNDSWCYAISHLHGMLSFVDCESFERIKEISLARKAARFMLYSYPLNCLIFMMNKSIKLFDLQSGLIKFKLKIQPSDVAYLYGDILYLGYSDGTINRYKITKWSLNFVEPEVMIKPHQDAVTSLDFSPNYYISSSLDMTCVIWNYLHSKLIQLTVPFPIYSAAFHGVKRHLLIGSKDSLMMLQGSLLFGDENWDPELIGLDSYDLLDDKLDPRLIAEQKVEKQKEEAKEAEQTQKKFDKSIINSAKKKALQKAYDEFKKNQEELIEQFNKDTAMGAAAKTPESRQRTVDQMLQLLDLAGNEESKTKENAIKNARLFIQQNEENKANQDESEKEKEKEKENEEEEEESENKKQKAVSKNSVKPAKFVSGADFIKNQIEIDKKNKKPGKRKSKTKKNASKKKDLKEAENENKPENEANLLEKLNSTNQKLNKSPNKRSKVEFDISKMSFAECTTENIEKPKETKYEYCSDDEESEEKKNKKKSGGRKKLKKAKTLSKINIMPVSKKSSQIQFSEKTTTTSGNIQKEQKPKKKNKSNSNLKLGESKNKKLKSAASHDIIRSFKNKKISSKSSGQIIDDLNDSSEIIKNIQSGNLNNNSFNISHNEFLDKDGQIQELMSYEYINDDGDITELPEGQNFNDKGQIVNTEGELIDEDGNVISDGKYRYRDKNGKICVYAPSSVNDNKENSNTKNIEDFTDCIFVDDFGKIVKICNVYLNDYGEYIDAFGEILTKISTFINNKGQKQTSNGLIVSENDQLLNENGQKVNINGEIIPNIEKVYYSDAGCQSNESIFMQRSINSRIQKTRKFFNPSNRRYRPSTPPPVLWNTRNDENNNRPKIHSNSSKSPLPINSYFKHSIDSQSRSKRSRTPPQLRSKKVSKTDYAVPMPNFALDCEAVLSIYGRGHVELLPLVFRLVREGSVSPSKVPVPSNRPEKSENKFSGISENLSASNHQKKSDSPQTKLSRSDVTSQSQTKLNDIAITSPNQINSNGSEITSPNQNTSDLFDITSQKQTQFDEADIIIQPQTDEKIASSPTNKKDQAKIPDSSSKYESGKFACEQNNDIEDNELNENEASENQSIEDMTIDEPDEEEKLDEAENEPSISKTVSPHKVTFLLPSQDGAEAFNTPTPPRQSYREHEVFKRPSRSPQPPKTENQQQSDSLRRSPRRLRSKNQNSSTFQLTSSEIYNEPDFKSKSHHRFSNEESEMIRQKRKNQQKSDKKIKFQVLGTPVHRKDMKNNCFPPKDHVDDHAPMPLNQKWRKFEPPEHITSPEDSKQSEKSPFNNESEKVTKFEATRSTRTTQNSLSMAMFYEDIEEKPVFRTNQKSIVDYSYLLEPGAFEEPRVAENVVKDFEDKDDILFSLRFMFPKTNQMAMMIQTPESIRNTRYSTSLQDYSKEYEKHLHSKSIKVKKKAKKMEKRPFTLKK